jgi:hypothetical protein
MDWTSLFSKPAKTYMEKLVKGVVMTAIILTTCWVGLAILIPEITATIFFGGLLITAGISVFIGQFMAWDG